MTCCYAAQQPNSATCLLPHPAFQLLQRRLDDLLAEIELVSDLQTALRHLITQDLGRKEAVWPLAVLPVLTCELVGGQGTAALSVTMAWNLLHLAAYTLDHLEDGDSLESPLTPPQSLNAATALIFLAQLALERWNGQDPYLWQQLRRELNRLALEMCAAQHRDLGHTIESDQGLKAYWEIVAAKSGAPFAWACRAGAILGGAEEAQIDDCADFGYNLGVLLQIADDWIGLGAAPVNDLTLGKPTLPVLYAFRVAPPPLGSLLAEWLSQAPGSRAAQARARSLILDLGGLHYLLVEGQCFRRRAGVALTSLREHLSSRAQIQAAESLQAVLDGVFPLPMEEPVRISLPGQSSIPASGDEVVSAGARRPGPGERDEPDLGCDLACSH